MIRIPNNIIILLSADCYFIAPLVQKYRGFLTLDRTLNKKHTWKAGLHNSPLIPGAGGWRLAMPKYIVDCCCP